MKLRLLPLLFLVASTFQAAALYPVTYIWHDGIVATTPVPGIGFAPGTLHSINDSGNVAGTTNYNQLLRSAAIWNGARTTTFGTLPGYRESFANGISNAGVLVGGSITGNAWEMVEPTEWSGSQAIDLGLAPGFDEGQADAINDSGQAVGTEFTSSHEEAATLWANGEVTPLSAPSGYSEAIGISNSGIAVGGVGSQPVAWINGVMSALPCSAGGNAYDINNSGLAVGICGNDAALWNMATGTMTDLGPGLAQGINNSGTVVGRTGPNVSNTLMNQTFVWSAGTGMQILPGFAWSEAFAINDAGYIVGDGQLLPDSNSDPTTNPTPPIVTDPGTDGPPTGNDPTPDIPEPGNLALVGLLALTGYGLLRRFCAMQDHR